MPLPVLQELMGHADVKTTRRYIHVGEQENGPRSPRRGSSRGSKTAASWQYRSKRVRFDRQLSNTLLILDEQGFRDDAELEKLRAELAQ